MHGWRQTMLLAHCARYVPTAVCRVDWDHSQSSDIVYMSMVESDVLIMNNSKHHGDLHD